MSQGSNEKHHFLSSLREEKLTLSANGDTMTDTTASEYGLRARVEPDNRPLGLLSDRQRGMRAAFEVLKGNISPRSAKSKYLVHKDAALGPALLQEAPQRGWRRCNHRRSHAGGTCARERTVDGR